MNYLKYLNNGKPQELHLRFTFNTQGYPVELSSTTRMQGTPYVINVTNNLGKTVPVVQTTGHSNDKDNKSKRGVAKQSSSRVANHLSRQTDTDIQSAPDVSRVQPASLTQLLYKEYQGAKEVAPGMAYGSALSHLLHGESADAAHDFVLGTRNTGYFFGPTGTVASSAAATALGYNDYQNGDTNGAIGNMTMALMPYLGEMASTVLKAGQTVSKYGSKVNRFSTSNLSGQWTLFGNKEYRLNPNMLGMNGVGIQSRPIGGDVNQNLRLFLHKPKGATPITKGNLAKATPEVQDLASEWKADGIDMKQFSMEDLNSAIYLRLQAIEGTAPTRYNIVRAHPDTQHAFKIDLFDKSHSRLYPENIGYMDVGLLPIPRDPNGRYYIHSDFVENISPKVKVKLDGVDKLVPSAHGITKDIYSGAVLMGNEFGVPFVYGEELLSAPQTVHAVHKYFPKLKVLGHNGVHSNSEMVDGAWINHITVNSPEELAEVTEKGIPATFNEGEVAQILEPAEGGAPIKSTSFDPHIIDDQGVMHIDWSKGASILKSALGFTLGKSLWDVTTENK